MSNIEREECPVHGIDYGVTTTAGHDRSWCQHCGRPANKLVMVEYVPAEQLRGAVERAEKAERALREFQSGLTDALRAHNVPAMPSWSEAIHWLARHGRQCATELHDEGGQG